MKRLKTTSVLVLISILTLTNCETKQQELDLIPYPKSIEIGSQTVTLPDNITFTSNLSPTEADDLSAYLPSYPLPLKQVNDDTAFLNIHLNRQADTIQGAPDAGLDLDESYRLEVHRKGIDITAHSTAGVFYALQTLAQLARDKSELSVTTIEDAPRFPYRGLHLDVSRHFFNVDYIKKQLDRVAAYKINRLHWHLTDGAGWRLEVPAYPRLTEFAAWRPQANSLDWTKAQSRYCEHTAEGAYGGYYTEADVKEIIEYARLRHITVIPEIEMPGHSSEVLAAYPNLACSGKPYTAGEVCIGNEETFTFFERVLDEVIRLFPSRYIHIGGDEASRRHWKECPKCQQRIHQEGLKDEAELQSYMIARIERYLNAKGKSIIGWDEILDGGIAPNATVMSWRGTEAGIKAAHMGHDAIMTPETHCYLDHYQDDPETQPLAFGATINLGQCYSYNPAPDTLSAEVAKHIIGVQGNVWAEYIPTYSHGEYMIYPRIIALAETGWTPNELKDADSFKRRINNEIRYIRSIGYNPFTLSEQVGSSQVVDYDNKQILLTLTSEKYPIDIRYTTDGSEPTASSPLYQEPFVVKDSLLLTARLFEGNTPLGRPLKLRTDYHKGIGKAISYAEKGNYYQNKEVYKGGGDTALLDGKRGGKTYMDGYWQGFCPNDLNATIDLGEEILIHRVVANFMQIRTPMVFLPAQVDVYTSTDGEHFTLLGSDICPESEKEKSSVFRDFGWTGTPVTTRYVRFHARQDRGHFLFVDEIIIQ